MTYGKNLAASTSGYEIDPYSPTGKAELWHDWMTDVDFESPERTHMAAHRVHHLVILPARGRQPRFAPLLMTLQVGSASCEIFGRRRLLSFPMPLASLCTLPTSRLSGLGPQLSLT